MSRTGDLNRVFSLRRARSAGLRDTRDHNTRMYKRIKNYVEPDRMNKNVSYRKRVIMSRSPAHAEKPILPKR